MALNYGISFCRQGIKTLEAAEEELFSKYGHGFDKFSQENVQLIKYRRMLKQFTHERDNELSPSYDPDIHGSFNQ